MPRWPLQIDEAEARRLAQRVVEALGWPWSEPVVVKRNSRGWTFRTNADRRGGNVLVGVDGVFGMVTSVACAPR